MKNLVPAIVRLLKRIVRRAWTILAGGFDHRSAQKYEMLSARGTSRRTFPEVFSAWEKERAQGGRWQSAHDEWFQGNADLWGAFVERVRDRKNLEIGSGPLGYLAPRYWMKRRIVIDPLIDEYRAYQLKRFGKTFWTNDIETHAVPAEQAVEELRSSIDGCIVSRNALDHIDDPLAAIEMIAEYAASGCYLLLWTDIWHVDGGDVGHRNITRSPAVLDKVLNGLGFDILQNGASVRDSGQYIEYVWPAKVSFPYSPASGRTSFALPPRSSPPAMAAARRTLDHHPSVSRCDPVLEPARFGAQDEAVRP